MTFKPKSLKDCIRTIEVLRNEIHKLHVRVGELEKLNREREALENKDHSFTDDTDIPF